MIDIRDYDMAVVNRIKSFYCNTHWISRTIIPLKDIRDRKVLCGEDISFPIILVRRTNCPLFSKEYNSWSRANAGQTYVNGGEFTSNKINNLATYDPSLANSIIASRGHSDAVSIVNSTFDLTYFIDVISLERDNFDTIVVELQENLFRVPYFNFKNIKSDCEQDKLLPSQSCHLTIEEIEDTSDLDNFDSGNALYRATITAKVNAYIYRKYITNAVEKFKMECLTKSGDQSGSSGDQSGSSGDQSGSSGDQSGSSGDQSGSSGDQSGSSGDQLGYPNRGQMITFSIPSECIIDGTDHSN